MAKVTQQCLEHLRKLEGLPGGRPALVPYKDSAGVWTNGFGHTLGVTATTPPITPEQAEQYLHAEASWMASAVDELVTVPLTDNQRDALILFTYNNGVGAFSRSTLLRQLNAGDYDAVPVQMMRWVYVHVNGKPVKLNGLINRRTAEIALWQSPALMALSFAALATALDTFDSGRADPPPDPANVMQTSTGKAQVGVLLTGLAGAILQGIQQAHPLLLAFQQAVQTTATLPQWLKIVSVVCIVASMAFASYTLLDKARKIKENRP